MCACLRRVLSSSYRASQSPHRQAQIHTALTPSAQELKTLLRQGKQDYLSGLAAKFPEHACGRNWHELWKSFACFRRNKGRKKQLRPRLSVRGSYRHRRGSISSFSELASSDVANCSRNRPLPTPSNGSRPFVSFLAARLWVPMAFP